MSFLNIKAYTPHEQELVEFYASMFEVAWGMSARDAKETAGQLLKEAIKRSKQEDSYRYPSNLGDIMLDMSKNPNDPRAEEIRKDLTWKREEGVTDEDIRWWWNLPDVDRRMMILVDQATNLNHFKEATDKGLSDTDAGALTRKYCPVYSYYQKDGRMIEGLSRSDEPLPAELKNRINTKGIHVISKEDIENSHTMNALIRQKIKEGKI